MTSYIEQAINDLYSQKQFHLKIAEIVDDECKPKYDVVSNYISEDCVEII